MAGADVRPAQQLGVSVHLNGYRRAGGRPGLDGRPSEAGDNPPVDCDLSGSLPVPMDTGEQRQQVRKEVGVVKAWRSSANLLSGGNFAGDDCEISPDAWRVEEACTNMNRMRRVIGLLAMLIPCPAAHAEPGPVINYLMGHPISQFSFGLFRIQYFLDKSFDSILNSSVDYDWDANQIVISQTRYGYSDQEPKPSKESCREIVSKLRTYLSVDPKTGIGRRDGHSSIGDYFRPIGYGEKSTPEDISGKIDAITRIKVELYASLPAKQEEAIKCEGRLLDKEVLFSE
jgi:hypothetical protein